MQKINYIQFTENMSELNRLEVIRIMGRFDSLDEKEFISLYEQLPIDDRMKLDTIFDKEYSKASSIDKLNSFIFNRYTLFCTLVSISLFTYIIYKFVF